MRLAENKPAFRFLPPPWSLNFPGAPHLFHLSKRNNIPHPAVATGTPRRIIPQKIIVPLNPPNSPREPAIPARQQVPHSAVAEKKPTIQSTSGITPIRKSTPQHGASAQKSELSSRKSNDIVMYGKNAGPPPPVTASKKSKGPDHIEDSIKRYIESEYHVTPRMGMKLSCMVPNRSDPLTGKVKFLGNVSNLPNRSHLLVAGLEIEQPEDLATDGIFFGRRYFQTLPKRAYFLPFSTCKAV